MVTNVGFSPKRREPNMHSQYWVSLSLDSIQKELLLNKPINGKGGMQSLFRKLKKQVDVEGSKLILSKEDIERIDRYRSKYGQGGFENRLFKFDLTKIQPSNNEFPI